MTQAGGIDPDAVEAGALAHDLGHPPFGHVAESELQEILPPLLSDSFEGNAQTFRIVNKLSIRTTHREFSALNLSRAVLRATLKYPWLHASPRASDGKWSVYDTEEEDFRFAYPEAEVDDKSVEAFIVDWADDIAYAVHDVQDFYRAGLVPLDRLVNDSREAMRFLSSAAGWLSTHGVDTDRCGKAFERLLKERFLPIDSYQGRRDDHAAMHNLASALITRFIDSVQLDARGKLAADQDQRDEIEVLKQLIWHYVINKPSLATLQQGERKLVRTLFELLSAWATKAQRDQRELARLPVQLRQSLETMEQDIDAKAVLSEEQRRLRAAADYLTSLTETQAVKMYQRLAGGHVEGSALDVWPRV